MNMLASRRFQSGTPGGVGAVSCLAIAVGMVLALAGCGKGSGPSTAATSAPPGSAHAPVTSAPVASAPVAAPPVASAPAQAPAPPANKLAGMTVADLLSAAREAYAQHRLVAPAGDNAIEYYEAVLAKDPGNRVARDALRETFPFGVPDVEKVIAQGNFAEAQREIDLLAKADPTNYTLTLLRSKLDAQQKLQARQQQEVQAKAQKTQELVAAQRAAADQAAAQQAAAAKAAAEREAAIRLAEQQKAAAARAAAAAPPPAPAKPAAESHAAKVVSAATPDYPVEAARNQTSGYAVVQFTVAPDGSIENAHIVESAPRRVFDNAAIQAVRRSHFDPAVKDGQPVASTLVRRIDFKFGG